LSGLDGPHPHLLDRDLTRRNRWWKRLSSAPALHARREFADTVRTWRSGSELGPDNLFLGAEWDDAESVQSKASGRMFRDLSRVSILSQKTTPCRWVRDGSARGGRRFHYSHGGDPFPRPMSRSQSHWRLLCLFFCTATKRRR
jgi:hypothetical protein